MLRPRGARARLVFASEERARGDGQVRRRLETLQRWELGRQPFDVELEHPLRPLQVPQAMLAQVSDRDPLGEGAVDKVTRVLRDEHLTAVSGGCDASRAMDVDPDVVACDDRRLAGMHPDANADAFAVRPRVGGKRALCIDGRRDGIGRAREGHEEAIAFRSHLVSVPGAPRVAHYLAVHLEETRPSITELLHEARRAFDVGEHECDEPCGWFAAARSHDPSVMEVALVRRRFRSALRSSSRAALVAPLPWRPETSAPLASCPNTSRSSPRRRASSRGRPMSPLLSWARS